MYFFNNFRLLGKLWSILELYLNFKITSFVEYFNLKRSHLNGVFEGFEEMDLKTPPMTRLRTNLCNRNISQSFSSNIADDISQIQGNINSNIFKNVKMGRTSPPYFDYFLAPT